MEDVGRVGGMEEEMETDMETRHQMRRRCCYWILSVMLVLTPSPEFGVAWSVMAWRGVT